VMKNRKKADEVECAKGVRRGTRGQARVLVMTKQLFHRKLLIKRCHYFGKRSSLCMIWKGRIEDAEHQDESCLTLTTLVAVDRATA
jgi:hypothetical protein